MKKPYNYIVPILIVVVVIGLMLINAKNPILYTFPFSIGGSQFSIYKYGVIIVTSILLAQWIASIETRRRGEDPDHLWDGLVWAIPAGMIGARLWYVLNDMAGGSTTYTDNPLRILNLHEGGLHFFGAILFGALAFWLFARRRKLDIWLVLDAAAPGLLFAQGVARIANYINQELYGQPTSLPWGVRIDPPYRLRDPDYTDLGLYPESTRFHPTFFYEMIYNLLAGALLMWLARRYKDKERPGAVFAGWLILAGVGRQIIEFFRPDQPTIPGTGISYSRIVAGLMIVAGALLLAIKYERLKLSFMSAGRTEYFFAPPLYPEQEEESDEDAEKTGDEEAADTTAESAPEDAAQDASDEDTDVAADTDESEETPGEAAEDADLDQEA
jgi:phosphatidylglycerol:prolipoprotein diacylglycerol transferase